MVEINLLPWRKYQRLYEANRLKKILWVTFLLNMLSIFLLQLFLKFAEQNNQSRIHYLQKELNSMEISIDKIMQKTKTLSMKKPPSYYFNLVAFMELLQQLDASLICFSSIQRTERGVNFIGKSRSVMDLTSILLHSNLPKFFSELNIRQLEDQHKAWGRFHFEGREGRSD